MLIKNLLETFTSLIISGFCNLPDMMDVTEKKTVAIGEYVPLTEGRQILLDKGQGGRLVVVQLVNN